MDVTKLGFSYSAAADGPWRDTSPRLKMPDSNPDTNPYHLPDLGEPSSAKVQFKSDSLDFINPDISGHALLSIQVKPQFQFVDGESQMFTPKLRSPLLKYEAKQMAKEMISMPLKEAWRGGEVDGSTMRALGLGVGGLAAAIYSPSEIRSRITLYKAEMGDLMVRPALGISSGDGKVDYTGAKVSISPKEQGRERWNMDIEYKPEDDRIGIGYNRSVSRVQVGPSQGSSYFHAGISKDSKQGTVASLSYHINY